MIGPLPKPTATAVRIAGDRYQWLHVWRACLLVLHDATALVGNTNPAVAVGVEVDDAGNVDDVVIYRQRPPHTYSQCKWAANGSIPVSTDYLTQTTAESGTSLIAKFATAYRDLTATGDPVDMVLQTNRNRDQGSPLLAGIDPRTQLLLPRAAAQGSTSGRGRERAVWANSAGVTEADLLDLLAVLRFETGHDLRLLLDNVTARMTAAGLRDDPNAVLIATAWIEQHVINGTRRLDADAILAATSDLDLTAGRVWPTVSVATLKLDPVADQAVYAIDWVQRFDGDDPYTRRHPKPPATWDQLAHDISTIPDHLAGLDAALITGSLRLATGFAVGAELRRVTNIDVAWKQGPQLWRSDQPYDRPIRPTVTTTSLGQGDDLAIVVDIATTATDDVIAWLRDTSAPVGEVLTLLPPTGNPKDTAIQDPAGAVALTVGIRDTARRATSGRPIHLFQAAPLGLALLLGHRWNRVAPTYVYEDLNPGYAHAFTVRA
jgi:hypothetical protein